MHDRFGERPVVLDGGGDPAVAQQFVAGGVRDEAARLDDRQDRADLQFLRGVAGDLLGQRLGVTGAGHVHHRRGVPVDARDAAQQRDQ
ncbi:hypothetical protein ACQPXM_39560 [Kribbella sp. CA-253562]|uniref:hypothetical protein n=1 Tax=Kribbella sp. CA-253562 TaxID=3239942 RepID=UPI003D8E5150